MDAKEFLKEWKRVCVKYGNCMRCPVFKFCPSMPIAHKNCDVLVDTVQKWAEEHPEEER